jgi:FAD/FMN-containing dehydrogenase
MTFPLRQQSGTTTEISDAELEELRAQFHGPLFAPGDTGYDDVRVMSNGMIDRRPGLIIQCSGVADVVDAVNLARERGLVTAVRGGGHNVAGLGTCDSGLMIDLSAMNGVWVDDDRRVVRVQGGATWGEVDRETQRVGLVVPGGVVSTTGVGGLTLGGGIGWLHRKFGLACDNLRSVEVVTAFGEVVRASASENAELFWALRGGGGNFGVATAFEFDAQPVGPIVMSVTAMYDVDRAGEILRAWRDWSAGIPDEVTTRAAFWSMPEAPVLPPAVHNKQVLIVAGVFAGPVDEGARVLQPLRELGTLLADMSGELPLRIVNSTFDAFFPKGLVHSYWKSLYMDALTDEAIDFLVKIGTARSSPMTLVHVPMLGGAMSRIGPTETAFGDRSAQYMLSVDGNWVDGDADAHIAWVRNVIAEARRFGTGGTYLNFDAPDEGEAPRLVEAAFGENLARLRVVKRTYDPGNLFRLNANITPDT